MNESTGNLEALTFRNEHDRGGLLVRNRHFGPIRASGCGLSAGAKGRKNPSRFEKCVFSDIRADRCVVGNPIFVECVLRGVKADFLNCRNALFLECSFEGKIDGVKFGLEPRSDPESPAPDPKLLAEYKRLLSKVRFGIDVRKALLLNVDFDGEEIIPYVLFQSGQCAIVRGRELRKKLRPIADSISDPVIRNVLYSATVCEGQNSALLVLEGSGASERVSELREVVSRGGIELIDQPFERS